MITATEEAELLEFLRRVAGLLESELRRRGIPVPALVLKPRPPPLH